jgi:site-specific DNA recombinase
LDYTDENQRNSLSTLTSQTNTTIIRTVSYSRVSSEQQARPDKVSLEEQEAAARAECQRRGWHYLEDYTERGVSGEALEERTALQRLLSDARAGKFDLVICRDQYRLGRSNYIYQYIMHSLKVVSHVQVLILTAPKPIVEPAKFNPRRDNSIVIEDGVMGMLAEAEGNTRISVLIQAKKAETAKGRHILGQAPFGYRKTAFNALKKRELEPDPITFPYLKMFPAWVLEEDLSLREIATKLQRLAVPVQPIRRSGAAAGGYWQSSKVHDLIKNPFYAGRVSYGRYRNVTEPGVVHWAEHHYERAWDEATRQAMLDRLKSRNISYQPPRSHASPNPLSGIIRCGYCGGGMSLRRKENATHWIMNCTAYNGNSQLCQNNYIRVNQFLKEELLPVLDKLALKVREQDYSDLLKLQEHGSSAKQLIQLQAEQTVIKAHLDMVPRRRERINQAYQGEVIDLAEYRRQLTDLAKEREGLEARLNEVEQQITDIEAAAINFEAIQSFAVTWQDLRSQMDGSIEEWPPGLAHEVKNILVEIYRAIYVKAQSLNTSKRFRKYHLVTDFEVK